MEIYSIDEAFLDFTGYVVKEKGITIKNKVKKWTGIPVSVGVAKNKVLAKIAGDIAKKYTKEGVFIFDNEDLIRRALNVFAIENLWGIGSKNTQKLKAIGIHTLYFICNSNWIKKNLSINGLKLQKELFWRVCYPLEIIRKKKKYLYCSFIWI